MLLETGSSSTELSCTGEGIILIVEDETDFFSGEEDEGLEDDSVAI